MGFWIVRAIDVAKLDLPSVWQKIQQISLALEVLISQPPNPVFLVTMDKLRDVCLVDIGDAF